MQFFKKALVSVLLVLAIVVPAFATVNVTWEWVLEDPEVQYFRYQLGGEAADGWTVVPSDTTSYELQDVDGSVAYTLYLQQSYDGKNWSSSAFAVSTPLTPEVPSEPVTTVEEAVVAPVEEEVEEAVVEETPVVEDNGLIIDLPETEEAVVDEAVVEEVAPVEEAVVEEPAPAEEAVVVEEPVVAKTKANSFKTTLDFSAGTIFRFEPNTAIKACNKGVKFNIGLGFENIVRFGSHSGLGLWLDGFGIFDNIHKQPSFGDYFQISNYGKEAGVDALLTYNFSTDHFKMILGGGADFRLSPTYADGSFTVFKKSMLWSWDIVGQLQARWQINNLFSLSLLGNYGYNLKNNVHEAGAALSMGFSF